MQTQKEVKELQSEFINQISQAVHTLSEKKKNEYSNSLESFEAYHDRLILEAAYEGKAHLASWNQAFKVILGELIKTGDKDAIGQLLQGVDTIKQHLKNKKNFEGGAVADFIGYDKNLLEKMFNIGRDLFEHDHVADAAKVFSLIVTLDAGYSACWTALGIILYAENHVNESLSCFKMACQIDEHNPIAYLYAARCYKKIGNVQEAQNALKIALSNASGKKEYAAVANSIKVEQTKF